MNNIKQLTFLRFLAAVLVVIFHYGKETSPFNIDTISTFVNRGSIAVSFFFFLSGVVLALNYIKKPEFSKRDFFIKRFARIYPLLSLAFISTLILGMVYNNALPKGGSIIIQFFSLHAWFPGICLDINYPSWSISVEIFFYLLFPFILVLMKKMGHIKSTIFIIVFWLLSAVQHYLFMEFLYSSDATPYATKTSQFISCLPLWHLNTFLMGILCAKYIIKKRASGFQNFTQARILYIIGSIIFFTILNTDNVISHYTSNGLMAPAFFLIIAGLSIDKSMLTKFLGNKTFILLGNASYAIYILQWPVFICISTFFGTEELNGYHFYIYLLSLILISIFTYTFFEAKMRTLILEKRIRIQPNKL